MLKIIVYLNLCNTCLTADEEGDQTSGINVLADLLPRCDNEQEYLLRWLQSPEAKGLTLRMKNMTLVELKVLPYTVKLVLSGHLKIDKTKVLMENGSLMEVESIAECSPWSILQYF